MCNSRDGGQSAGRDCSQACCSAQQVDLGRKALDPEYAARVKGQLYGHPIVEVPREDRVVMEGVEFRPLGTWTIGVKSGKVVRTPPTPGETPREASTNAEVRDRLRQLAQDYNTQGNKLEWARAELKTAQAANATLVRERDALRSANALLKIDRGNAEGRASAAWVESVQRNDEIIRLKQELKRHADDEATFVRTLRESNKIDGQIKADNGRLREMITQMQFNENRLMAELRAQNTLLEGVKIFADSATQLDAKRWRAMRSNNRPSISCWAGLADEAFDVLMDHHIAQQQDAGRNQGGAT